MSKKGIKVLLIALLTLMLVEGVGTVGLDLFYLKLQYSLKQGEINRGGLRDAGYPFEIIWERNDFRKRTTRRILKIEIEKFNNYDWRLFVPFCKNYEARMLSKVTDEFGKYLGEIRIEAKVKAKGIISRKTVIKRVKRHFAKEIESYISRGQDGFPMNNFKEKSWDWKCKKSFRLTPRTYYKEPDIGYLFEPKLETVYCIRYGLDVWRDTIYYENYYQAADTLIGYEISEFSHKDKTILQRVYWNDGRLAKEIEYKEDSTGLVAKESFLGNGPEIGEYNWKEAIPGTKRVRLMDRQGEVVLQRKY